MAVSFKLRGVNQMRDRLKRIAKAYPQMVAQAMYVEAQIEMTEAKKRTPVDTRENAPHPGQLRNSGMVSKPEREGTRLTVVLSFGGLADAYAIHVHENPDAFHPVGQWKYLESVLNESRPYMIQRIGARVGFEKLAGV